MMGGKYLLLGSNLGDRRGFLEEAIDLISGTGIRILRLSSVYESAPWGIETQPAFLNQVVEIETTLSPEDLLETVLDIEKKMGRQRGVRWTERKIDIDILYYDDVVKHSSDLIVPHPGIAQRRFVLTPMAELAPELIHPVVGLSQSEMLKQCHDQLWVRPLDPVKPS